MAKELPKQSPEIIWTWDVCCQYKEAAFLDQLMNGKKEVDAHDVLSLDIRPVDKLWVLMREAFTPIEVLEAIAVHVLRFDDVSAEIKQDVAEGKTDGKADKEFIRIAPQERSKGDYLSMTQKAASAVKHLGVRGYGQEYQRILDIYVDELSKWENAK